MDVVKNVQVVRMYMMIKFVFKKLLLLDYYSNLTFYYARTFPTKLKMQQNNKNAVHSFACPNLRFKSLEYITFVHT